MKPLIVGNWKMHGLAASVAQIERLITCFDGAMPERADVVICPPATLLMPLASQYSDEGLEFGGQDCHANAFGAHTGDISAEMLADAGAAWCIVGHSERRTGHGDADAIVQAKAAAAIRAGLIPIICIGETAAERRAGEALGVVTRQLAASIPAATATTATIAVAYEPVWAIGTGVTPTLPEIAEMHRLVRARVGDRVRLLYGGSVTPANAPDILGVENVNGALVGGASLKAEDFAAIVRAA